MSTYITVVVLIILAILCGLFYNKPKKKKFFIYFNVKDQVFVEIDTDVHDEGWVCVGKYHESILFAFLRFISKSKYDIISPEIAKSVFNIFIKVHERS